MGWVVRRTYPGTGNRYTAYYRDLRGRATSAGTFSSKRKADKAWQHAEIKVAEGRAGDPRRGKQTFRRYVEKEWLPRHVMEISTRESYTYQINKHIMPWFGSMRMIEILPAHVREWVAHLQSHDVHPKTIQNLKNILSAIFTSALNDVTFLHPCKGVKTPTVPTKPLKVITPEQFDSLYHALSTADAQLLVETAIESGLRWGELSELRVDDVDYGTHILTVTRAVVEVNPKFHTEGKRFLVKPYPKDKEYRRLKLSSQIIKKLRAHAQTRNLGPDALFFGMRGQEEPTPELRLVPDPRELGYTEPNASGRSYRHGTLSGYSGGRCRCRHCRRAYAVYRAQRRTAGMDEPRRRRVRDTDGHIPRDWFRTNIWKPALESAGIETHVTMKGLRHAHASWLLAGGADLQVVKERLGHGSISTTEKYLHTLPEADDTALLALARTRSRHRRRAG